MFKDEKLKFTPWFKLICESMLFEWWEHLDEGLERYLGERQIRRMWRGRDMVNGYRLRAFLLVACFKLPLSFFFFFASSYIGPGTSLRQRYDPTQLSLQAVFYASYSPHHEARRRMYFCLKLHRGMDMHRE